MVFVPCAGHARDKIAVFTFREGLHPHDFAKTGSSFSRIARVASASRRAPNSRAAGRDYQIAFQIIRKILQCRRDQSTSSGTIAASKVASVKNSRNTFSISGPLRSA